MGTEQSHTLLGINGKALGLALTFGCALAACTQELSPAQKADAVSRRSAFATDNNNTVREPSQSLPPQTAPDAAPTNQPPQSPALPGNGIKTPPIAAVLAVTSPLNITPVQLTLTFAGDVSTPHLANISVDGGVADNLAGSGKAYTFDVKPATDGPVTVWFAAGGVSAANGAKNAAAPSLTFNYDTTAPQPPTVDGPSLTNNTQPTWTWAASSVTASAGSGVYRIKLDSNAFDASETETKSLQFTPTATLGGGAHTLYVQERDLTGNWSASGSKAINIDLLPPSAAFSSTVSNPTSASPIPVSISFDEVVIDFTAASLTVSGATLGNFNASANTYTFDLTPTGDGPVSATIAAGAAHDAAGNGNPLATFSVNYNSSLPSTPTVTVASPTNDTTPTWNWSSGGGTGAGTYRFKLDSSDLSTGSTTTTATSFSPGSALTPGTHTLFVQETDGGSLWSASGHQAVVIDVTPPSVNVASSVANPSNVTPFSYTVTFSKAVTNFVLGDLTVVGGTASNFLGSGTSYTFDIAPNGQHAVTVDIAANVAVDAAGNQNTAAAQLSITYDTVAPTAPTVAGASPTNDTTPTWTWTATGGGNGTYRYKIDNSTLSAGSTTTTSATFTPASALTTGSHTLYVQERDDAGNWSTTASRTITIDTTAPTATITSSLSSPTLTSPIPVTVTFSKSVTGFASGSITIGNGSKTNFAGSGTTYTLDVTPSGNGPVTIDVGAAVATDAAGNANPAASQLSITYDNAPPTLPTVTGTTPTNSTTPTWSWTAGGGGNGSYRYKLDDSDLTSGSTPTTATTFTPGSALSSTSHTLYVQERDIAGNWSPTGSFAIVVDTVQPTVSITTTAGSATNTSPIPVTITFSESVTGFGNANIVVVNGTKSGFAGSGSTYTVNIAPTASAVTVNVASGVAADSAGNTNTVATQLSVTYDTTAPTAPTVTGTTPTTNTTPTWTWTAGTGGNGTFRYKLDNATLTSGATTTTSPSYTPVSALTSVNHTLYVQERDDAGNWSSSGSFAIYVDAAPPTVGGSGTISASSVSSTSLTLGWTASTDNRTSAANLQYQPYYSLSNNIDTIANAEANGTAIGSYTANINSKAVTGLTLSTTYYFNVIVKDQLNNKSIYNTKTQATTADLTAPTVTTNSLYASAITSTSLTLAWTKATDDVTSQSNLQYEVRKSTSSNITSVANIESNGTIVCAYATNVSTCNVTGLDPNTSYYFNIIAKDGNSNKLAYAPLATGTSSTTVASVSSASAIGGGGQRKSFYDTVNGKHWAFYNTGTAIEYSYSSDNSTWTAAGTLAYASADFSVTYKSIGGVPYVFLVAAANNYDVILRRGALASSAITFASEQTVFDGSSTSDQYQKPSVTLDANDLVWVAAVHRNSRLDARSFLAQARRSSNSGDGDLSVWDSASTFGTRGPRISDLAILPRTGSQVYLLINAPQLIGYAFDGTAWTAANSGGVSSWMTFPGAAFTVWINAVAIVGSDIYIGGYFTDMGGVPGTTYIARWDGSQWRALGSGLDGVVSELVAVGNDLYAGGEFTHAGGIAANRIAKWNGVSWSPLGAGLSNTVNDMAVMGSDLYVGGFFTSAGGIPANNIAKWNGTEWSALGSGTDASIFALKVVGSDLYVGGNFLNAGGTSANYVAKWDGSAWSALGAGFNNLVRRLAVVGTDLYAAGMFSTSGGGVADYIAKWNGSAWSAVGSGYPQAISALAVIGTDLYVSGGSAGLQKWNGTSWSAVGSGTTGIGAMTSAGSDLYVVGTFTSMDGNAAGGVAKWDGTNWTSYGNNWINGAIYAMAAIGSDIYITGMFSTINGVPTSRIAKWDGTSWSGLGSGLNNDAYTLAVIGTDLYVGGSFTTAGGSTANHIAKWDGTSWSTLSSGVNNDVQVLTVSGTDLYAGGYFTTAGGSSALRVAKWNGSAWSALGSGFNFTVNALMADGTNLYAGGAFTLSGATSVASVAKWNGTAWSAMGSGFNGTVTCFAIYGGNVIAGGSFTFSGASYVPSIAQWNGTTWSSIGTAQPNVLFVNGTDLYAGTTSTVAALKWDGSTWTNLNVTIGSGQLSVKSFLKVGDDLYTGGTFGLVNGMRSDNFAAYRLASVNAIDQGGTLGMSAVSDTTTGNIYVARTYGTSVLFNSYNGTAWSAATSTAASYGSQSSTSYDINTGNYWLFWIDSGLVKYKKFTLGSGWGSIQNLTNSAVSPAGIASDFDMANGVVKVLIQDGNSSPPTVVIKTVN